MFTHKYNALFCIITDKRITYTKNKTYSLSDIIFSTDFLTELY